MMSSINLNDDGPCGSLGIPKVVWMLWLQGWDRAPSVVDACLRTWQKCNPGWDVRPLTLADIPNVLDDDRLISLSMAKKLPPEAFSDIVRIALLRRYGGVWVDSTCYCLKALDAWISERLFSGFFAFADPGPDRMISSWFLAASKNSYIIETWYDLVVEYWRARIAADNYYWFHYLFADGYRADSRFRDIWDRTPKVSAAGPHHYVPYAKRLMRPASFDDRKILNNGRIPLLKLTHKIGVSNSVDFHKNSVLDYLVQRAKADSTEEFDFRLSVVEWFRRNIFRAMHLGLDI